MVPGGVANLEKRIEQAFPADKPYWDYNTEEGRIQLDRYHAAIIQGPKRGARKPTDILISNLTGQAA